MNDSFSNQEISYTPIKRKRSILFIHANYSMIQNQYRAVNINDNYSQN